MSYRNDIGVELASEHKNRATSYVTLRDNLIYRNRIGGLFMGGYDARRGRCEYCAVTNNTFFQNDTKQDGNGEIYLHHYVSNNTVSGNIIGAGPQSLLVGNPSLTNSGNVFDYNLYFAPDGASESRWQWKKTRRTGFDDWKSFTQQDGHSLFTDPLFVDAAAPNLHLQPGSPAINAGDPAFAPGNGETDIDGEARVSGDHVDIGADEY